MIMSCSLLMLSKNTERLAFLGPGARAAGQRRNLTLLEERRRREAQAYHLARAAHGLRRVGRAFVP